MTKKKESWEGENTFLDSYNYTELDHNCSGQEHAA